MTHAGELATDAGRLNGSGGQATPAVASVRNPPRPTTKCAREACRQPFSAHRHNMFLDAKDGLTGPRCPGNTGKMFKRYSRKRPERRASFSVSARETAALVAITGAALALKATRGIAILAAVEMFKGELRSLELKALRASESIAERNPKSEAAE